jgi:hypothetical protein
MTPTQQQTVWALCRQGLPLVADVAAEQWENRQHFKLDQRIDLAREVYKLIEQSNWEAHLKRNNMTMISI